MAVSSLSAAKMICERGEWKITNLALQKILYMAHMIHVGQNDGARLIDAEFEAWDYGPVVPELYRRVRMFGSDPIEDVFFGEEAPQPGSSEYESLDEVCSVLIGRTPGELVSMTHWKDGAWAQVYEPGVRHTIIPDEQILNEYKARERRAKRRKASNKAA